ncbi:MAG: phosphomannose isomerase type II C-terminal cupin domain [Vampirovibrionales bacterium]|nr:phosphomannose isomerase type II C-terminal cupin domain [Vampirovibrionales bacterium]
MSTQFSDHYSESRPWGTFHVLQDEPHFKLKRILVEPKQRLSLQKHHKREEHWLVTKGQGIVTVDSQEHDVKTGTYIHIPQGAVHRISNPFEEAVEFIEVQLGDYFGEDDIVRLEDDYNRA